jgi:hypothetical protein
MKTKEREGAKKGGYLVTFKELIRPSNKVGLKETKTGSKRLMFRLQPVDTKGVPIKGAAPIPYSFEWDLDGAYAKSALGAIGVQASRVKQAMKKADGALERVLIWLEKEAKTKAQPITTYVREDGGFATGLKPPANEEGYYAQFVGVASRGEDKQTLHWYYSKPKPGKKPGTTWGEGNFFKADFRVLSGPYKDAQIRIELPYAIVKDEDDEWMVDADSGDGAKFKRLLTLHKISTDNMDPDRDFQDVENGLPELNAKLLKRADSTPLIIILKEGGWLKDIKGMPAGTVIEGMPTTGVEVGSANGDEYKADSEKLAKLFSMIDRRVRKSEKKSAWLDNGKLSTSGREWLAEAHLPHKFEVLTDKQVDVYIARLKEKFPIEA